jgi:hypothetical protein
MTEMLPRLSLVWDRVQADPDITLLVPNFPYARTIFEDILKVAPERMAYYRFGAGWNPCEVFYGETVIIPTPTTTGNPAPEMFDELRSIFGIPEVGDNKTIVYFSRRVSGDRMVANEDELISYTSIHPLISFSHSLFYHFYFDPIVLNSPTRS